MTPRWRTVRLVQQEKGSDATAIGLATLPLPSVYMYSTQVHFSPSNMSTRYTTVTHHGQETTRLLNEGIILPILQYLQHSFVSASSTLILIFAMPPAPKHPNHHPRPWFQNLQHPSQAVITPSPWPDQPCDLCSIRGKAGNRLR